MPLKVRVRNFQSIEDATMVIDGLTVCTGTNNAGKSAFFRAIRGAVTNARGTDFVRHGAKHCIVDIEDLETGQTLTWKKGSDGTNDYVVNGKHYPKVGAGVPPEAKILSVEPVTAGNSEFWPQIAPQITGVSFLLDQPGPVIAEAVADVERVNRLSRALKGCESERRTVRGELKTRRKDAEALKERREGFVGLQGVLDHLAGVQALAEKAEKLARARTNMAKLAERYRAAKDAVRALEGLEVVQERLPAQGSMDAARGAGKAFSEARSLGERRRGAKVVVDALAGLEAVDLALPSEAKISYAQQFRRALGVTVGLAMRFEEARQEAARARAAAEATAAVALDSKVLERVARVRKAITSARGLRDRRARAREEVGGLDQQIRETSSELEALSARVSEALGAFEECPTCGVGLGRESRGV